MVNPPAPPYVGPASAHGATDNKPIHRVVIHSTVSPCVRGGARTVASWFRSPKASGSAHYVVDPGEVVQVVYDNTVAYHAPPNQHSIGIELCDIPTNASDDRWDGPNHREMLDRAAKLTAQLCLAYDVPLHYRSAAQLAAGARGITTHAQVTLAFGQSTHWDPGKWPMRRFMRKVRRYARQLRKGTLPQ